MAPTALGRLVTELTASPSRDDVTRALASLRVKRSEDGADIERLGEGAALGDLRDGEVGVVRIGRGVYASVPTAAARVSLLESARRAARDDVTLHVVVTGESSHLGRALIDTPRRLMRLARFAAAEPGDRFGPEAFAHCFFDEESLLGEIARAGLTVVDRRGFTLVLRDAERASAGGARAERAAAFTVELARVVRAVRAVDSSRRDETPRRAVAAMRARGSRAAARGPIGRARLRRAIGWVDALTPPGANCYRRVLLEIALDAGAARETIAFGLDVGSTGHVAFEGREERSFDVSFAFPAE